MILLALFYNFYKYSRKITKINSKHKIYAACAYYGRTTH